MTTTLIPEQLTEDLEQFKAKASKATLSPPLTALIDLLTTMISQLEGADFSAQDETQHVKTIIEQAIATHASLTPRDERRQQTAPKKAALLAYLDAAKILHKLYFELYEDTVFTEQLIAQHPICRYIEKMLHFLCEVFNNSTSNIINLNSVSAALDIDDAPPEEYLDLEKNKANLDTALSLFKDHYFLIFASLGMQSRDKIKTNLTCFQLCYEALLTHAQSLKETQVHDRWYFFIDAHNLLRFENAAIYKQEMIDDLNSSLLEAKKKYDNISLNLLMFDAAHYNRLVETLKCENPDNLDQLPQNENDTPERKFLIETIQSFYESNTPERKFLIETIQSFYKPNELKQAEQTTVQDIILLITTYSEQLDLLQEVAQKLTKISSNLASPDYNHYAQQVRQGHIEDAYTLFGLINNQVEKTLEREQVLLTLEQALNDIPDPFNPPQNKGEAYCQQQTATHIEILKMEIRRLNSLHESKKNELNEFKASPVVHDLLYFLQAYGDDNKLFKVYQSHIELSEQELKKYYAEMKQKAQHNFQTIKQPNLSGLHLCNLDLSDAPLNNANLRHAKLTACTLGPNLNGVNLCDADLSTCTFKADTSFVDIKINKQTKLDWQAYGAAILCSNFADLGTNEASLRALTKEIAQHDSSVITGKLMSDIIDKLSTQQPTAKKNAAGLLEQQKQRARLVATCLLPNCKDPTSLIELLPRLHQVKNFIRKHRNWFHWSSYGNTTSWQTLFNNFQTHLHDFSKVDDNIKQHWKENAVEILRTNFSNLYTDEEYLHQLTAEIITLDSSAVTGQLIADIIQQLSEQQPSHGQSHHEFLLQQKHRAKFAATYLSQHCTNPTSLLAFKTLAEDDKHFLREERHWFRWSLYGNTATWNTIFSEIKTHLRKLDHNELTLEQSEQYNRIMRTATGRWSSPQPFERAPTKNIAKRCAP